MAQLQQDNLFFDVQQQVCKILNDVPELSAIDFFPSNNKDLDTEITTSLRKQGVCGIVIVDEANFQGFDSGIDTAWQIDNLVVQIIENPIINRASNNTNFLGTCQDIGTKVSQVLGGIEYGHHQVFNLKTYEEGEENGLLTSKISFQCLVTTNLSSYVPPEDPTQRIPFATEPWVISNFLPISAQVEPPSSYENLSVTNLSSETGIVSDLSTEKIIIKEKGDNLVPIAIEQLSALEYPDKRYSNLYIYNISNDTSASWGSDYDDSYATKVYIGYNPKTRKCHTNYSGLYVPTIDTTRNIDNYLSNRTSVTTYQLNSQQAYTKFLRPGVIPYKYEPIIINGKTYRAMIDTYLSVANLAIVDFPGYENSYPAAINFLSSKYSPYTFSLKNADFYRLKILKNDVSGNLSVNNITGKNAYFDNLSGTNINIDDVINTDIYEDGSKMVSFPSKCQFGDDVTFKNSIQTSAITSEDGKFVDLSSDNISTDNLKSKNIKSTSLNTDDLNTSYLTAWQIKDCSYLNVTNTKSSIPGVINTNWLTCENAIKVNATPTNGYIQCGNTGIEYNLIYAYSDWVTDESGNDQLSNEAKIEVEGTINTFDLNIPGVLVTKPYNTFLAGEPRELAIGCKTTYLGEVIFNYPVTNTSSINSNILSSNNLSSDNGNIINLKNNYLTSDVITCNNSLYSNYIECNNITGNVINLIDQTSETGTTKGLLNTNEISAKTIYVENLGDDDSVIECDGALNCMNIRASLLECSNINVFNMGTLFIRGSLDVLQKITTDDLTANDLTANNLTANNLIINGDLQVSESNSTKVTTDDIFTKDFTCEGDVDCNTITIGGVSLNSTQLNKLLALIS